MGFRRLAPASCVHSVAACEHERERERDSKRDGERWELRHLDVVLDNGSAMVAKRPRVLRTTATSSVFFLARSKRDRAKERRFEADLVGN